MNRSFASLLFVAAAVFYAGCDGDPGAMGAQGSAGSAGPAGPGGPAGPAGPTGPDGSAGATGPAGLAAPMDLVALVRAGMDDPEYVDPRDVNGFDFFMSENPNEFDDWF